MKKVDYKKVYRALYSSSATPVLVEVPDMRYLMVDGKGDPNTAQEYRDAIEALYAVSYTLKFMAKRGKKAIDYGVMPLEGLWWVDDMSAFDEKNKASWKWTSMIMQPECVDEKSFVEAVQKVKEKKNPVSLSKIRFAVLSEGLSTQVLHVGPYAAEAPTIARLHEFIRVQGYKMRGHHHEIYLSDLRRTAPEKLKTIIRQPVSR